MKTTTRRPAAPRDTLTALVAAPHRGIAGVGAGVVLIVALIVALIVGVATLNTYQNRAQHRQLASVAAKNLTRLLERSVAEILDKADLTLKWVMLEREHHAPNDPYGRYKINEHLRRHLELMPQLAGLRVADADGRVRLGTGVAENAAVNIADTDYFVRLRDDPDADLIVSGPLLGRIDRKPVLVLARRLPESDGSFAGIAYATIDVELLQQLFAETGIGARGAVALRNEALELVARHPDNGALGRELSDSLRQLIAAQPRKGAHPAAKATDGIERTVAYRRVGDYPLYLVAGLATDDYLAPWRDEVRNIWLLAAIAVVLTCAGGYVLLRARQRHDAAAQAIARESQRNQMLLRTASDGMFVVNADGRVLEVNDAFCALLGYAREDLLQTGTNPWNLQWSDGDQQQTLARIFASGSAIFETRYRRRDGRVLNVEINAASAELDGRPVLYASVRDITWRKQAENALRESEQQLRRVFDGSEQGFWEWNLIDNALSFSSRVETMLGYAPGEMRLSADTWLSLVEPSDVPRLQASIASHLSGEAPSHELEMRMRAKSGEWRWILTRGRVVKWTSDDRPLIAAGTHTDITERKRQEAALLAAVAEAARADRAKSRFLAAASHDLRQPLSALSLYLGALKARLAAADQDLMKSIEECVGSLSTLLTDLLDVSKLDAGSVVARPADFSVDELLRGLITVHAGEARLKGLRLRLRPSAATAYTDPVLLRRVLGNLIANAIRYTTTGGVLVGCRRRGGKLSIEIWDSGIGIPEDQREWIFEEFSQLGDPARTHGSGLGLAIVAKTTALLRLPLRVRSRPGRGSCFAVEVPRGRAPAAPVAAPGTAPASERLRIALVEDHPDVLRALVLALELAGHEVVGAISGGVLLARLAEHRPDLVISDYRLGDGENGFDVIESLRQRFGDDLPALLVTGDTDPALIRAMADRGIAVRYKPLQLDTLLAFIKEALRR